MNKVLSILLIATSSLILSKPFTYQDYKTHADEVTNDSSIPWNATTSFIADRIASGQGLNNLNGVKINATEKNPHFQNFNNDSGMNEHHRLLQTLPINLDLRKKYPFCFSISQVRQQSTCGSCWAVAAMTSLSDRFCIKNTNATTNATGKAVQRTFSYNDALTCCPSATCGTGGNGCNGGFLNGGYNYAKSVGISTGDAFQNSTSGCRPYFLSPNSTTLAAAPACSTTCQYPLAYKTPYSLDKMKITSYKYVAGASIAATVTLMMQELNTFGSIIAFMYVYQEFFSYKTGIYVKTANPGNLAGGHAITIIGYGTTNGVDFWLVRNSWGTGWGQNGFFQIQKGVNMCSIEALPTAAYF